MARVEDVGDGKLVYFEREVAAGTDEFTYFVSAPAASGSGTFGRVHAVRSDGGQPAEGSNWEPIPGTTDTAAVVGASTEQL